MGFAMKTNLIPICKLCKIPMRDNIPNDKKFNKCYWGCSNCGNQLHLPNISTYTSCANIEDIMKELSTESR